MYTHPFFVVNRASMTLDGPQSCHCPDGVGSLNVFTKPCLPDKQHASTQVINVIGRAFLLRDSTLLCGEASLIGPGVSSRPGEVVQAHTNNRKRDCWSFAWHGSSIVARTSNINGQGCHHVSGEIAQGNPLQSDDGFPESVWWPLGAV